MQHLQSRNICPGDVIFLDAGTLSFTLADAIAEAKNLIIFDAAELGETPGAISVFEGDALDDFLLSGKRSVHEVGFADLMDIARLQDCLPGNRALIGIQPGDFGWGDRPGEVVAAAIPRAADFAMDLLEKWTGNSYTRVVNQ